MNLKSTLSTFTLFLLVKVHVFAQCPASITATAAVTNASCPSNGSVTISTTPAATASYLYSLTAGPAGTPLNVFQSSNIYFALQAGSYTARVTCGSTQADVNFTIGNAYTPISSAAATVTPNCGSFAAGATINITATGGTAPLQYSVVNTTDPNYADSLSMYTASAIKTVSSYGTYQVRVKDACNQFYTSTVQVGSSLTPVSTQLFAYNFTSCSPTQYKFYYGVIYANTGAFIDFTDYNAAGGVKVNIYEQSPSGCSPTGPLLTNFLSHGNWLGDTVTLPIVASNKYYIQTISPCGDTTGNCVNYDILNNPLYSMTSTLAGCGTAANPFVETIMSDTYLEGVIYPLTVKLYRGTDATGTLVGTQTANSTDEAGLLAFTGLTADTYYMESVDACGHINSQVITDPTASGSPNLDKYYFATAECTAAGLTTQTGTSTAVFTPGGFLPNQSTAEIIITSGPSNIGVKGAIEGNTYSWKNLLPGNYTATITTSCGSTNVSFTVADSPDFMLKQSIVASSTYSCGAGSGNISAAIDYNGGYTMNFVLVNASTSMAIDSNAIGSFINVAPGQYYVKLKLTNSMGCDSSLDLYYVNSNTVTISSPAAGPQITKKLGITCEDVNGNPLTSGTAYISVAGVSPLLIEYKPASSSVWTTFSANAPAESAIPGLTSGITYDIRITSCGITNATQVAIGPLGRVSAIFSNQPCIGSPYELALPQLAGATFEWRNPSGTLISTTYNYTFPVYSAAFDGKYAGTVKWNGCTLRSDTVTLNSALCGQPILLPVQLASFTASVQNCAVGLNWTATEQLNITQYIIERSNNGYSFSAAGNVPANSGSDYRYTDNAAQQGIVYYRLKMKDADGHFTYSNVVTANTRCNTISTQWSLYPSVSTAGNNIMVKINTSGNSLNKVRITVNNATGQQVEIHTITLQAGQNNYSLNNGLPQGIYFVNVSDASGQQIGAVEKLVIAR